MSRALISLFYYCMVLEGRLWNINSRRGNQREFIFTSARQHHEWQIFLPKRFIFCKFRSLNRKHRQLITLLPSLIARRWVGRQAQWWPRHKAIYFSWFGPELFCLLLGPPGFNCWFSSAPVFQWCCSTPQGSPGVGRNTFLSSPHLCFIIGFICDLFVTRDDPLMS